MIPPFPFNNRPFSRPIPPNFNNWNSFDSNYNSNFNSQFSDSNLRPNANAPKDFSDNTEDNNYFEILGIKLYFDDLLIICLLFSLYQEDVKDTYLYIALILLLLS